MNERYTHRKILLSPLTNVSHLNYNFAVIGMKYGKAGRGKNTFLDIWGLKYLHKAKRKCELGRQRGAQKTEKYSKVFLFFIFFFVLAAILR